VVQAWWPVLGEVDNCEFGPRPTHPSVITATIAATDDGVLPAPVQSVRDAGVPGSGRVEVAVGHGRDLGVLVLFADEIHAAARVCKTHATSGHTFASPNGGPLGYVVEGLPTILNRPTRRVTRPAKEPSRVVTVELVTIVLGDSGVLAQAAAEHSDGLVVAAFGAGHVPAAVVEALSNAASRIPVVLASRTGAGSVLAATYAFPGSESDLLGRGLISAGMLHPLKARVLLHHLLATGRDRVATRQTFAEPGGYPLSDRATDRNDLVTARA